MFYFGQSAISYSTLFKVHSSIHFIPNLFRDAFIHWYESYSPLVFFITFYLSFFNGFILLYHSNSGIKILPMTNCWKKENHSIEQMQQNKMNAAVIFTVTVVIGSYKFWQITMDYLSKLIELNKNTRIVNRCLPLNCREISMHFSLKLKLQIKHEIWRIDRIFRLLFFHCVHFIFMLVFGFSFLHPSAISKCHPV